MKSHPNALVTFLTGLGAAAVYKYAHQFDWLNLTQPQAMLAATSAASVVLYVGRRGPVQTGLAVWKWVRHGLSSSQPGSDADAVQALVQAAVAAGVAQALAAQSLARSPGVLPLATAEPPPTG